MDRGNGDAFLNPESSQGINEMCIAFSNRFGGQFLDTGVQMLHGLHVSAYQRP